MKKIILSVLILFVLISACTPAEPTPTPTSTVIPTATNTPTPTLTPIKTPTPTTTPTITPLPNQDELKNTWQPVVNGIALQNVICPMIIDTAIKLQNDEIDSWGALTEMIAEALFINAIEESFAEWEPEPEIADHKYIILDHNEVLKDVLADWFNDEITSVDVPGLLEDECPQIEADMKVIIDDARAHGMSDVTLKAMLLEMEEGLEEMKEELEN